MSDALALALEQPRRETLRVDYEDGSAHFLLVRFRPGGLPFISFEGPHQNEPQPALARIMAAGRVYSAVRDWCHRTGDAEPLEILARHDETLRKIIRPALELRGADDAVPQVQG